jgi:hypothetical protein
MSPSLKAMSPDPKYDEDPKGELFGLFWYLNVVSKEAVNPFSGRAGNEAGRVNRTRPGRARLASQ